MRSYTTILIGLRRGMALARGRAHVSQGSGYFFGAALSYYMESGVSRREYGAIFSMGVLSRFRRLCRIDGQREAACGRGWSVTRAQLLQRIDAAAGYLAASGVDSHSRVGLTVSDELDNFIASLAMLGLGCWHVILASHDSDQLRREIALRAQLDVLVAGPHDPTTEGLRLVRWDARLGAAATAVADVHEGGVLLRTSGTTGTINLVPLISDDIVLQAQRQPGYAERRLFRPASLEHNNSKRHRLYCLAMGGTNVFRPNESYDIADYCREQHVTAVDLTLMHAADLAASGIHEALAAVDWVVSGSEMPFAVRRRFEERVSRRLYVRYGSTECGTVSIAMPGEHDEAESVGRPVPGLRLEIVDGEGNVRSIGETGHIRLQVPGMATGYFNGPEQTERRFRDGWFWPGDMGVLRPDGSLIVKGRADDMMILNGINIFPVEIESVLERHPAVAAAAAAATKSAVHGDIPVAAVELKPGQSVDERELMAFARQQLSLRAPRRIVIVPSLPRNAQGKLLRRAVPDLLNNRTVK